MVHQNKKIRVIDETPKGRKGISEMIERMMKTRENGEPELQKAESSKKTTA